MCWPATIPTPRPACTNTATSAKTVNHHNARVRSDGSQLAPRAHAPASPLLKMSTHAQPLWTSSRDANTAPEPSAGAVRNPLRERRSALGGELLPGRLLGRGGLGVGLGRDVDQVRNLLFGEAGHVPELAGQVDRVVVVLSPQAAEAEQLVDGALEVEGVLLPFLVVGGEPPQPVRTHLHV